jgi:predicted nucleic acid-binding Zn ribbon protein
VCGRGFNPGTATCPDHGEELVPAAAFVPSRPPALAASPISRTICPVCGKQDSGETRFCGECGAAVVPINGDRYGADG